MTENMTKEQMDKMEKFMVNMLKILSTGKYWSEVLVAEILGTDNIADFYIMQYHDKWVFRFGVRRKNTNLFSFICLYTGITEDMKEYLKAETTQQILFKALIDLSKSVDEECESRYW
ncbi:MAG: hypothetical protein K2M91_16345 [Lachnospiraceae bacterium]|nr:hypothetical protein [Lachnospiraceae bacterium]